MFGSFAAAFFSLFKCLFSSFADAVGRDGFTILFRRLLLHPEVEKIFHRTSEILFAAKVVGESFCPSFCGAVGASYPCYMHEIVVAIGAVFRTR